MSQFNIQNDAIGMRADVFVSKQLADYSRSALEGLFDSKDITINGRIVKPSQKLHLGDKVSVDTSLLDSVPEKIELPVIYEDEDMVVINKPAGILTHSKGAINSEPTVASFIKDKITDKSLTGNRAGIAHRLDRGTSGVIITAKSKPALEWLQNQFSQRKVKKTYRAIVEGAPKDREAVIDAPIGRNPAHPQSFKVTAAGRPAQTSYEVLKTFKKAGKPYSLLTLNPATGRTHQLRVHLAYIKTPIVGDHVYGKAGEHMLLHAESLKLAVPGGAIKTYTAPQPKYFKDFEGGSNV
jgi:23S rRNA pseudouridine1911/1915/1917 synthase